MINIKNIRLALYFTTVVLITACGKSDRELATELTNRAQLFVEEGDTLRGIELCDSIQILYPKAEVQVGVAQNIKKQLYLELIDGRINQIENLDTLIDDAITAFNVEKTEFDRYTRYVHKRQTLNRSWDRSFLQVNLDERGILYLTSNYMGKEKLSHTGIRVYDGKHQSKSEKVALDDPYNQQSDFMDYIWEKVSYTGTKSDSVIHFIAENPKLNLKCVFLGDKYSYILLEDYDIDAVVRSLELSELIKQRDALKKEVAIFERRRSR